MDVQDTFGKVVQRRHRILSATGRSSMRCSKGTATGYRRWRYGVFREYTPANARLFFMGGVGAMSWGQTQPSRRYAFLQMP